MAFLCEGGLGVRQRAEDAGCRIGTPFAKGGAEIDRREIKNPWQRSLPRTNKQLIRGATLLHGFSRALCGVPAYPRQLTYVLTLQNTLCFHAHLTAPSAAHLTRVFLARFPAPRALCEGFSAVTSASTVLFDCDYHSTAVLVCQAFARKTCIPRTAVVQ